MSGGIERAFEGCSRDVFNAHGEEEPFCNQENWQSSVIFLNQEVEFFGLPSICSNEGGNSQLDVISLVNVTWSLVQAEREKTKKISNLESQVSLHTNCGG